MEEQGGRKKNDIIQGLIEDYVYSHNGVVCRSCFKTIDLTEIQPKGGVRDTSVWERLMGVTGFKAICPHCKKELIYHMTDVRPVRKEPDLK